MRLALRSSLLPVPFQPLLVVPVEEVRLYAHCPYVRVDSDSLQQRACPSFLDPDDQCLGQLLLPIIRGAGGAPFRTPVGRPPAFQLLGCAWLLRPAPQQRVLLCDRVSGGRRAPGPGVPSTAAARQSPAVGRRSREALGGLGRWPAARVVRRRRGGAGAHAGRRQRGRQQARRGLRGGSRGLLQRQRELQRTRAAQQAVAQVGDGQGQGAHEEQLARRRPLSGGAGQQRRRGERRRRRRRRRRCGPPGHRGSRLAAAAAPGAARTWFQPPPPPPPPPPPSRPGCMERRRCAPGPGCRPAAPGTSPDAWPPPLASPRRPPQPQARSPRGAPSRGGTCSVRSAPLSPRCRGYRSRSPEFLPCC
jgi:hypothetical protein